MKFIWTRLGIGLFWFTWPGLWLVLHDTNRSRIVVRSEEGSILLVRGWLSDGRWGLPGGGIHKDELASEGACRELAEETGLDIDRTSLKPLKSLSMTESAIRARFHFFAVHVNQQPVLRPQRFEIADIGWFAVDALPSNLKQEVITGLKLAG